MLSTVEVECPPRLLEACYGLPPLRTAVVNAVSEVVIESVRDAAAAGVIEPVLYGDPAAIARAAEAVGWAIEDVERISAAGEEAAAVAAANAAGRGDVAALMKGHVHTDVFMRAILDREAGLRTDRRLSHVFHMTVPDRDGALLITDAALNTHPDVETRKTIIANAVDLAHALGLPKPNVALLSATETPTEEIPSSVEAVALTDWAAKNVRGANVFGPLAFDLAVSPDAARIKGVEHPVAGRADVIVVPDIVCGNPLFKMMVYLLGACAAGVVLGAKVPILLTSRADPPAARLASAAVAAVARHGLSA